MWEEDPVVVMAHSPRAWARILKQHMIDHGGGRVLASIMAEEDALQAAYDVFIADDITSFLSARLVIELQRRGIGVLGVYDPGEGSGKDRLVELGVDEIVEAGGSPHEFVQAISRVVRRKPGLADFSTPPACAADPFEPGHLSPTGRILVVAGASGGVGVTEIAIALALILSRRRESTVLVDADDVGPSVVQRLGLDVHPNIRTAVSAVRHRSASLTDSLIRGPGSHLEVLGGLANRRDWFELRPIDVSEVIIQLASVRDRVVVNLGSRAEDLPALSGPARYGVARAVLALAGAVVLVASPSPVGAARVLDWITEARSLIDGTPVHVAFNGFRGGRFKAAELDEELRDTYRVRSSAFLPFDKNVWSASWQGAPTPRGRFLRAVEQLATTAVPRSRRGET